MKECGANNKQLKLLWTACPRRKYTTYAGVAKELKQPDPMPMPMPGSKENERCRSGQDVALAGDERQGKGSFLLPTNTSTSSGGGGDVYKRLRLEAYRSKVLKTFSFLGSFLLCVHEVTREENEKQLEEFFQLTGMLPLAEQWVVLSILHEESLSLEKSGHVFLSSLLVHVRRNARHLLSLRALRTLRVSSSRLPKEWSVTDLLRKVREDDEGEVGVNGDNDDNDDVLSKHQRGDETLRKLLLLFVDILLAHSRGEEDLRESVGILTSMADPNQQCTSFLRRSAIELLLNAKAMRGDRMDKGEIRALVLSHQDTVESNGVLESKATSPGCLVRMNTFLSCLNILGDQSSGAAQAFQPARKHALSILLIKVKMLRLERSKERRTSEQSYQLKALHSHMRGILGEVIKASLGYWSIPSAMVEHARVVLRHYYHYDVVCERKISNLTGDTNWMHSTLEGGGSMHISMHIVNRDLEDKVVVLCLLQLALRFFTDYSKTPDREVLTGPLLSALGGKQNVTNLCKIPSLLWQSNQGRNQWLANSRFFEAKPYSSFATAFVVMLHLELIRHPGSKVLINSIIAVLEELQAFVLLENKEAKNGGVNGTNKLLNESTVQGIIAQVLLLSAVLAAERNIAVAPRILSCMRNLQSVCDALAGKDFSKEVVSGDLGEHHDTLLELIENVHKPYFQLLQTKKASSKGRPQLLERSYWLLLQKVVFLLLHVVDSTDPVKDAHDRVLQLATSCLSVLQFSADSMQIKQLWLLDYVVISMMKLYKKVGQDDGMKEKLGRVKRFVLKCIETFSIQKKAAKQQLTSQAPGRHQPSSSHAAPKLPARSSSSSSSRVKRSRNAFIDAAVRGEGYHKKEDGDLSDLEDFIVCKPGRDYIKVLSKRRGL